MVSMKLFIATATVAKAGANVDHVSATASHIGESQIDREVEIASEIDDAYFTSRGFYGSSRTEEPEVPEFVRKEVDCSLLKGNQTLPIECCVFANSTESVPVSTNSTIATNSTIVDECDSLTGMARIQCSNLKFQPLDCSKFKGNQTMPYECAVEFGMIEETPIPETIILEEAQPGDELTWEKAFNTMFPGLIKNEESFSADESCFSCPLTTLNSFVGRLASKAANLVESIVNEPVLSADDELDCYMQLGNQTMTVDCTEELDGEFVNTNSTIAKEPKISPLGFIVEEIDCDALKGNQTLPWECMNQTNSTQV